MWRTVVPEWPQLIGLVPPASNQSQPPTRHANSKAMRVITHIGRRSVCASVCVCVCGEGRGGGGGGGGSVAFVTLTRKQCLLDSTSACLLYKRKPLVNQAEVQSSASQWRVLSMPDWMTRQLTSGKI